MLFTNILAIKSISSVSPKDFRLSGNKRPEEAKEEIEKLEEEKSREDEKEPPPKRLEIISIVPDLLEKGYCVSYFIYIYIYIRSI